MKRLVLASLVLTLFTASLLVNIVPPVKAFNKSQHEEKTNKAFDELTNDPENPINFSPEARKKVNKGNTGQDGVLSGTWDERFHGDRKSGENHATAFNRLRQYIKQQFDLADELFAACETEKGLDALGRALHSVQDFYAHSNYVELDATEQAKAKAALDDPGLAVPDSVKMCGWWSWPFTPTDDGGWFRPDDPYDYSHSEHAHEEEGTADYAAANAAAVAHTKEIIKKKWSHLTEAKKQEIEQLAMIPYGDPYRTLPSYMEAGHTYAVTLEYTGVLAVGLRIGEGLPYGVVFLSSTPNATFVDTTYATVVVWDFADVQPIEHVQITYSVRIGDNATIWPTVVAHCEEPVEHSVNFRGWITEFDVNGTEYETMIGGAQVAELFPAGDLNHDHVVDIFDIVRVAVVFGTHLGDPTYDEVADINKDGYVDIFDIVVVAVHFGATN